MRQNHEQTSFWRWSGLHSILCNTPCKCDSTPYDTLGLLYSIASCNKAAQPSRKHQRQKHCVLYGGKGELCHGTSVFVQCAWSFFCAAYDDWVDYILTYMKAG